MAKDKKKFAARNEKVLVNPSMLRARRLFLGKKIKEVAAEMGISSVAISRWEHGYSQPAIKNLVKLSHVYKCDIKLFLTDTARVIWTHLETMLLEHSMAQAAEMEEGQLPNLDINQFTGLAERLGVFTEVEEETDDETDAQGQMAKEIR